MNTILICDDDKDIVSALDIYLTSEGYATVKAYDGLECLRLAEREPVDLILLDVMMPGLDGIRTTAKLRESCNVPIILLTAKSEDSDKILGLNIGADDYITKPFNPIEVIARVKSQLRRYTSLGGKQGGGEANPALLTNGGIALDDGAKSVTVDGEGVSLTPIEYNILLLLMKNPGRVFSTSQIYELVWNDPSLGSENTVAVHIRHLREKIEIDPANPYYIVSMANYYEATGNKDAAEEQIRTALVNEKLDVDTKVGILSRYILKLQQTQKDTDSSNALFQTLLEQHPEDTELKQMYGSLLLSQGKTDEARFQFQLITEMEPENAGAWQQLLNMSLKAEDIPEVIRICTKCQELFPDAPEYYFYLGIAYYQQEKYQEALNTYYAGIDIIPAENPRLKSDFYGQIGDIYYQMKQMDQTYKAYDEALKYNDNNIVVLNNYAYFLSLDKKDLKKAERMSAQCIKLEPDNATYLDTYAWIFFVQGNYTLAKIYIESALEKDKTKSAELVDHYGDILYMTGDKDKAVEQWKKARELGKESEVLDRKIIEGKYIEEEVKNE